MSPKQSAKVASRTLCMVLGAVSEVVAVPDYHAAGALPGRPAAHGRFSKPPMLLASVLMKDLHP
jgi:hypothetical protein